MLCCGSSRDSWVTMPETRVDTEERYVYVDLETGEQATTSPALEEARAQVEMLERDLRSKRKRISQLEGQAEEKARNHKLWDEIEAVFDWYRLATAHFDVKFEAEEFNQALPRWKQYGRGSNPCKPALKAICGIAFNPSTTRGKNGRERRFDKWELLHRNQFSWTDFMDRVPGDTDTDWWRCLMDLIEGNLKP
jgi:hypothetical protein